MAPVLATAVHPDPTAADLVMPLLPCVLGQLTAGSFLLVDSLGISESPSAFLNMRDGLF